MSKVKDSVGSAVSDNPLDSVTDDQWTDSIRSQFPILDQRINGHPLDYLDTAATAQKPDCVIEAEKRFYETLNAGVHRGTHTLAARATMAYEQARARVARLVGADWREGHEEIVVTPGCTAALNMLATSIGYASLPGYDPLSASRSGIRQTGAGTDDSYDSRDSCDSRRFALRPGDEIVVSQAEHHSVLLPLRELALRTGAKLRWFGTDDEGRIRSDTADTVITKKTRIVAVTLVSNVTGAITDVAPIIEQAHEVGALVVLDLCQAVPHLPIDVKKLGCDFAVWSGHKMYGPTGVGYLYGRRELLEALPPAFFGGEMVDLAYLDRPAVYERPPLRFEAGTQPVAQAVANGVAVQWLGGIGLEKVESYEREITAELLKIADIPGIRILGPLSAEHRVATVSFEVEGVHPHDVGQYLDMLGIAVRTGHHCAQPIHRRFGVEASSRASAGVYTSVEDARRFVEAVRGIRPYFLGTRD